MDYRNNDEKERHFLLNDNLYTNFAQRNFSKIPGSPIAYWVTKKVISVFEKSSILSELGFVKKGMDTGGDIENYIKIWAEVNFSKFSKNQINSKKKWFPYSKGGGFRRWYGNNDFVINWEDDGKLLKNRRGNLTLQR